MKNYSVIVYGIDMADRKPGARCVKECKGFVRKLDTDSRKHGEDRCAGYVIVDDKRHGRVSIYGNILY